MLKASDTGQIEEAEEAIRIALPHTLSLHHFPKWLSSLRSQMGTVNTQLRVGNVLDVVLWLVKQGNYELKPGSVISLGSLGGLHPAAPGQRIEAEYRLGGKVMKVGATLAP